MDVSRRRFMQATTLALVAGSTRLRAYASPQDRTPETLVLTTTVAGAGQYAYLPFAVPEGVNRIDVEMRASNASASLGLGLFDERGAAYQSPGFRGVFGAERSAFFITAESATEAFVPGPIRPGTWTVMVPVFTVPQPTTVEVRVTLSFGAEGPAFVPEPEVGVVLDQPGWYRGDLHCHTTASSDAWASGSAMSPREWAEACRAVGLDFVAMTDHNVISQNYFLAGDAGADMLLMPGEEMTNWFHGHATVSGIKPGEWLDWRQSPLGLPLPTGGARISEFIRVANEMGAYISAAHPFGAHLSWQFTPEMEIDPASRTHGFEVWTGQWQPDDETALHAWDNMLQRGIRMSANGGSDLHGTRNGDGLAVGTPTTVVYAPALSKPAIVTELKAGRCFVTRHPKGAEVYLTAAKSDGQATYVGGSVYGGTGDQVTVRARVRSAGGMQLLIVADGAPMSAATLGSDDETVEMSVPIPPGGGYVRAEVRSGPTIVPASFMASNMGMEAFTNPIWLVEDALPSGYVPEHAPVPAARGPRRSKS